MTKLAELQRRIKFMEKEVEEAKRIRKEKMNTLDNAIKGMCKIISEAKEEEKAIKVGLAIRNLRYDINESILTYEGQKYVIMSDRIDSITMDQKNYYINNYSNGLHYEAVIKYKTLGSARQDTLIFNLGTDKRKAYSRLDKITGLMLPNG